MNNGCAGVIAGIVLGVIGLLAVLVIFSASTVSAGYVGLVLTNGRVEPGTLEPGLHIVFPFTQRIVSIDTRVQPHNFKQIGAASSELQSVVLTGTMNYHLDKNHVSELYQTVGLDFANNVIDPAFSDFMKETVPHYQVTQILNKRDEIRSIAKKQLGDNLARYGIIVDDIYISDISFSSDYQAAIEAKQTAQQNVEKEQQILDQKSIQAKQAIVDAQGKADAAVATAKGEAEANQVRASGLTPELIDYLRWQRWDGHMPQVVGSNSSTLLDLNPVAAKAP